MKKEELQKKSIELQILGQQLNQIQQQILSLQSQSENLKTLQESLDEIEKTKIGNKILAPLSSGVLIDTELKNNKEVILALGANVTVKKTIPEAKEIIKDQEKQLYLIIEQLKHDLQQYSIACLKLEQEISQSENNFHE